MDFEVNGQKEMSCALSQQNDYMLQDLENLLKYACSSKEGCCRRSLSNALIDNILL